MTTTETSATGVTVQVHRVYIKATPQAIWDAITRPEWSQRYGYRGIVDYDLRPGGAFRTMAGDHMPGMGRTDVVVEGEVVEVDPLRRLVHTWRSSWLDEPVTTVTWEIKEGQEGVCALTVSHDVTAAPQTAAQFAGNADGAGGGWPESLSDLKSLLETGSGMYS